MAMMISACKMEATPMLIRAFSYSYKSLWGGTMGGSELEQRGIGKSRTFRDYLEAGGRQAKSNGHRNLHVHQRRGGGGRFILSNPEVAGSFARRRGSVAAACRPPIRLAPLLLYLGTLVHTYGTYLPVPRHNIVTAFQLIPVGLMTSQWIILC